MPFDPMVEGFTEIPTAHFVAAVSVIPHLSQRLVDGGMVFTVTHEDGRVELVGFYRAADNKYWAKTAR